MGTLRCYEWIENEDGTKTSAAQGLIVNGVLLGEPLEIDGNPDTAEFDDSTFPNGTIDGQGNITVDEQEQQINYKGEIMIKFFILWAIAIFVILAWNYAAHKND